MRGIFLKQENCCWLYFQVWTIKFIWIAFLQNKQTKYYDLMFSNCVVSLNLEITTEKVFQEKIYNGLAVWKIQTTYLKVSKKETWEWRICMIYEKYRSNGSEIHPCFPSYKVLNKTKSTEYNRKPNVKVINRFVFSYQSYWASGINFHKVLLVTKFCDGHLYRHQNYLALIEETGV